MKFNFLWIAAVQKRKVFFVLKTFLFFFLSFSFANAQGPTDSQHAIILEAAGIGGYGSLNYERNFFSKKNIRFNASIGLSTYGLIDFNDSFNPDLIIPLKGMFLFNWKTHHLMVGIGQTFSSLPLVDRTLFETKRRNTISGSILLGYRWQRPEKRFFIQLTYSPLFQQYQRFRHWGGLGFGFSFKKNKSDD